MSKSDVMMSGEGEMDLNSRTIRKSIAYFVTNTFRLAEAVNGCETSELVSGRFSVEF